MGAWGKVQAPAPRVSEEDNDMDFADGHNEDSEEEVKVQELPIDDI